MIFHSSNLLLKNLDKLYTKYMMLGNYYFIHGSFSSKSINIITDIDIIDYYEVPKNNIIDECKLNNIISNEVIQVIQNKLSNINNESNIFFKNVLCGYDDRFLFDFDIDKNLKILNYNPIKIKNKLRKLYKNKILRKKEYSFLIDKVKKEPSISEFYDLVNHLEKYYQLTWTYNQIEKGFKIIRKKKFYLKDMFTNYRNSISFSTNPIIFNYIILIDDIYLNIESTLIFCYLKKDFYLIKNKKIENIKHIINNFTLLNEYIVSEKHNKLKGLCKNIPKEKYFKMFKRLRSLITVEYYNSEKYSKTLDLLRSEMNKILRQKYNVLSQFKNRCQTLSFLQKYIDTTKYVNLYNTLLEDLNVSFKNRNIDINIHIKNLDKLEHSISKYLNNISKSIFLTYYNRSKKILNIDIPELNSLYLEKEVVFDDDLLCRSYVLSNIKSNKKYKFFKSYFQYALDWSQCKDLIPMDNKIIENTLMYMFNKFKSGLFVKIQDNQIKHFVPFFNLNFKNNWSHLIDTKDIISNETINKNISKWSCLNCIIKTKDLNRTDDMYYAEFKHMLECTLKRHKIKNTSFFMNRKDFPILTKKGIEPYHHIFGENVALTSYRFDEYAPILSPTNRLNIFADILIPTDNCWKITTQSVFPVKCENIYIDNDLNSEIRGVPWKDKIETAIWRGHSTGCALDFRNPRLLISKINQEWKNDPKLKNYLDAGVVSETFKYKTYKASSNINKINLAQLGLVPLEKMDMKEQMKYKYILDIEGNASAYRLGYLLSFKSVLLKVDSEYKMWIDKFLKPNIHYIPIHKDFSNLATMIEWCRTHDKECKEIAENAYKLFKQCFTKKFICKYLSKQLNSMKNLKL